MLCCARVRCRAKSAPFFGAFFPASFPADSAQKRPSRQTEGKIGNRDGSRAYVADARLSVKYPIFPIFPPSPRPQCGSRYSPPYARRHCSAMHWNWYVRHSCCSALRWNWYWCELHCLCVRLNCCSFQSGWSYCEKRRRSWWSGCWNSFRHDFSRS